MFVSDSLSMLSRPLGLVVHLSGLPKVILEESTRILEGHCLGAKHENKCLQEGVL